MKEDDYIRRGDAVRGIGELCDTPAGQSTGLTALVYAAKTIEALPAADVRPVVRGHKVTHNRPIAGYWASGKLDGGWDGMEGRVWVPPIMDNPVDYCSECGKRLDDTFQNFCPNCGADMREVNDGA